MCVVEEKKLDRGEFPQIGDSRVPGWRPPPSESCSFGEAVMSLVAEERIRFHYWGPLPNARASIRCRVAVCPLAWVKCGAKGIP